MSTAVHPERLAGQPFKLPVWGVTTIALIALVVGIAGGIVVGNSLAKDETAPAATKAVPATIVVPEGAAERPWPAAYPITKPGLVEGGLSLAAKNSVSAEARQWALAKESDHPSTARALYRKIHARPPVKSS